MQKFKFSYDRENDDLFIYNTKSKSKGSVELGDVIFDYNNKKELVGLQIMNASKIIKECVIKKNTVLIKEVLDNLKECKVNIKGKNKMLIITIYLSSKMNEVSPILTVPRIQESSPALAYA